MPATHGRARLAGERSTVRKMIAIYCRDQHGRGSGLCEACEALHAYAMERLDRCPFGPGKSPCSKCPVHCYRPEMRERIRDVMRYAGPRMWLRDPLATLRHILHF